MKRRTGRRPHRAHNLAKKVRVVKNPVRKSKKLGHPYRRLKQRIPGSDPSELASLSLKVKQSKLPRGDHHVRLGHHGYVVLKDIGKHGHRVATVYTRNMKPPGSEVSSLLKVAQIGGLREQLLSKMVKLAWTQTDVPAVDLTSAALKRLYFGTDKKRRQKKPIYQESSLPREPEYLERLSKRRRKGNRAPVTSPLMEMLKGRRLAEQPEL